MPFVINGEVCHYRGTVSIVSADNPASTSLGGFKETAAAFRFCRHCTGTEEDVQSMVLNVMCAHAGLQIKCYLCFSLWNLLFTFVVPLNTHIIVMSLICLPLTSNIFLQLLE